MALIHKEPHITPEMIAAWNKASGIGELIGTTSAAKNLLTYDATNQRYIYNLELPSSLTTKLLACQIVLCEAYYTKNGKKKLITSLTFEPSEVGTSASSNEQVVIPNKNYFSGIQFNGSDYLTHVYCICGADYYNDILTSTGFEFRFLKIA